MFKHARTAITGVVAAATLAASTVVMVPAASAAGYYNGTDGYVQDVRWYPRHHYRYYGHRYNDGAAAAGLFGFLTGAFVGSALSNPYRGNSYCEQRFRSYNPRTGTYTGYDGLQHPCP